MLKPQAFCVQNKHFSNKLRSHLHYQFSCFDTKYSCFDSYLRSEILDNISRFAIAEWNCISKSMKKKLKFIFFRILSLDFSSYTSYDFLISKERTPNSQKSARISIHSKFEFFTFWIFEFTTTFSPNIIREWIGFKIVITLGLIKIGTVGFSVLELST